MAWARSFRRYLPPPLRRRRRLRTPLTLFSTVLALIFLLTDPPSTSSYSSNLLSKPSISIHQLHIASHPTVKHLLHMQNPNTIHVNPGVTLVAACRNRHEALEQVFPSWLHASDINQIILIDWASSPPLKHVIKNTLHNNNINNVQVKVVRVLGESRWVLSRAFNLGMQLATFDKIVRLDCDYQVDKRFLSKHLLDDHQLDKTHSSSSGGGGYFYAGNYGKARNENEVHLNGAVVIKRSDFWNVGGYDERIQTYGWDDEDLYGRLKKIGLNRKDVNFDVISHLQHGDNQRANNNHVNGNVNNNDDDGDDMLVQVEIDLNALLIGKLAPWSYDRPMASKYVIVEQKSGERKEDGTYIEVRAVEVPKSLAQQVPRDMYKASWDLALGRRLNNDYQIPWDVLISIDIPTKESLLKGLISRVVKNGPTPRVLFVHCQHGLGNRLRALGSAMAFAKNTNRELVVVWEKDAHIQAGFRELFANHNMHVMNSWAPRWPFTNMHQWDASWKHVRWYNYMEMEKQGAIKGEKIANTPDKHIYYKGAYIMEVEDPKLTNWDIDNEMLRTLEPVSEVQQRIQQLVDTGLRDCVGVHIRNRTLSRDIHNINFNSEYGREAAETMDYWRRKSGYRSFVQEMRNIVKADPHIKFYVATDTVDVVPILKREFPGRISYTSRQCDDREGACVRFALTDIYALARTKYILGSNWSSFTEAAQRIGGVQAKLAGQDFSADPQHASKL